MDLSIIITTYNYERYLEECIESCLQQLESSLLYEVIVIDDGSTDGTRDILDGEFAQYIRSYHIPNSGIEKASNFGFAKAAGTNVVRVDADDCLKPNFCQVLEPYLLQKYDFYYSDYDVIDSKSLKVRDVKLPEFCPSEILTRGDFLATGTVYRRDLLPPNDVYSTSDVNTGLENYELIIDLLQRGCVGLHIPASIFSYRRHTQNLSKIKVEKIVNNGKHLFNKKRLGEFTTNKNHPYGLEV